MNNDLPPIYTVYKNPKDYPDKFVVRRWIGETPDQTPLAIEETLEGARGAIRNENPYLTRLERNDLDDPVIVETWI